MTTEMTRFLFRMYDFIQKFRSRILLSYNQKNQTLLIKTLSQEDDYYHDRVINNDLITTIESMFPKTIGGRIIRLPEGVDYDRIWYLNELSGEYGPPAQFKDAKAIRRLINIYNDKYQNRNPQKVYYPDFKSPITNRHYEHPHDDEHDTRNITIEFDLCDQLSDDEEKTRDNILDVLNVFKC